MYGEYFEGFEKGIFSNVDPSKAEEILGNIVFPDDNSVIVYTDRFRDMLTNDALRVDFLNNFSQSILSKTEWTDTDKTGLMATIFVMGKALTDIIYNSAPISMGPVEQLKTVLDISAVRSVEIRKALETILVGILPEMTLNIINPISLSARKGQEKYYLVIEDFLIKSNYYGRIMNLGRYLSLLRKKAEVDPSSKWARPEGYELEYALLDSIVKEYYEGKYGKHEHYIRPFFEVDFFHYLCENWPSKKKFGAKTMVARNFKAYTPFPALFGYYIRDDIDDAEQLINDFESHKYERSENVGNLLRDISFSETIIKLLEKKNIVILSESAAKAQNIKGDVLYQDTSWPPVSWEKYEFMLADEERIIEEKILKEKLSNLKNEGYFELQRNFAYIDLASTVIAPCKKETSTTIFYNPSSDVFALSTENDRFDLVRDGNTRDYICDQSTGSPVVNIHKIMINDRIFVRAERAEGQESQSEEIDYYEAPVSSTVLDEFTNDGVADELKDGPEDFLEETDDEQVAETDDMFDGSDDDEEESDLPDEDSVVAGLLDDDDDDEPGKRKICPRFIDISEFLEMGLTPVKKHYNDPLKISEPVNFVIGEVQFSVTATLADRPGIYRVTIGGFETDELNSFEIDENDAIHYAVTIVLETVENAFAHMMCSTVSEDPSVLLNLAVAEYS